MFQHWGRGDRLKGQRREEKIRAKKRGEERRENREKCDVQFFYSAEDRRRSKEPPSHILYYIMATSCIILKIRIE